MSTTATLRQRNVSKRDKDAKLIHEKVSEKGRELFDSRSFVDEAAVIPEGERTAYESFMADLINEDRSETLKFDGARAWTQRIVKLRRKHHVQPSKAQMSLLYSTMLKSASIVSTHSSFEAYLRKKATRSLSGIVVIAVVMSPYPTYTDAETGEVKQQRFSCAKNCYYCPNEPGMPRSYLSEESAIARAARAKFDAIQQFYARANTLKKLGHTVDKIELSVLGGTFSQYPREYQTEFLRDLFWSANTFNDGIMIFSQKRKRRSLAEEIKIHESSAATHRCRIVGLTLETRPDTIANFAAVRRLREFGATRLQIGVQHTDDAILSKINRGCEHSDAVRCVRLLKNSGYKIDIHLMPNLPGATVAKDKAMFAEILDGDLLQADQWKVYPCQTVDYTLIKKWYEEGSYKPYALTELMEVVIGLMAAVKPWIRLNRMFRALPAEHITVGITQSNFRQVLVREMEQRSLRCNDIRSREVGTLVRNGTFDAAIVAADNIELRVREYNSSGGREYFISLESRDETVLIGFVRLRLPPCLMHSGAWHPSTFTLDESRYGSRDEYVEHNKVFPELYHSALVREAHVYGFKVTAAESAATPNGQAQTGQSRGYGMLLMTEAEKIAKREGYARVAVIAGVGTRKYYRAKLGYRNDGTYMVKDLLSEVPCAQMDSESEDGESEDADGFEDMFEERVMADVGTVGAGAVKTRQRAMLTKMMQIALALCVGAYVASLMISILSALLLSVCYMALLNYALFWSVPFGVTERTNRLLLAMSRFTMLLLDAAVLGKIGSSLMPSFSVAEFGKFGAVPLQLAIALGLPDGFGNDGEDGEGEGAECMCSSYWTMSLVSYVSAIYAVKLLYYKRASLMMKDPMVAGAANGSAPPCSVTAVMCSLVVVFLACQYLVTYLTDSECTGKGVAECCRDTFAPINTWFAIAAIALDLAVLVRFMTKWNAFLSLFAEEAAGHMMNQFLLVSVVMLSCVFNALCHLSIVYMSLSPEDVDSFQGTPAFLFDVCIMGTCVVLFFVDAQQTMAQKCETGAIRDVYNKFRNVAAAIRVQMFGGKVGVVHDAYIAEEEEP